MIDRKVDNYIGLHVSMADPGLGVRGDEIPQGDLRVPLLLSHMFMERMMQEN